MHSRGDGGGREGVEGLGEGSEASERVEEKMGHRKRGGRERGIRGGRSGGGSARSAPQNPESKTQ